MIFRNIINKLPFRGGRRTQPQPSIVLTTQITNPRLIDASVDTSTSPSTISGVFGIDITNSGILDTRSTRITDASIKLIKGETSINIGSVDEPQEIKDIPAGDTRTIKFEFDRETEFADVVIDDICNIGEITADMQITVAEILLAATYSSKETIQVESSDCNVIKLNISGQSSINVNQTYEWSVSTESGATVSGITWDMGDGTTKRGKQVSHEYTSEGEYNITVTTEQGNTASKDVVAERLPLAIVGPTSVRVGENNEWRPTGENLQNLSGFEWSMGDGTLIQGQMARHKYSDEGTYTIRLISDQGESTSIEVLSSYPNISIQAISGQDTVQFDQSYQWSITGNNLSEADRIEWNMGDGSVKQGNPISHTYRQSGDYTITVNIIVSDDVIESRTDDVVVEGLVI
mgnify:CR=1 FL=1